MYYKGHEVQYTIGEGLGEGSFGYISKMEIMTPDGIYECAIKIPHPLAEDDDSGITPTLDELAVFDRFPKALTCDGIVDMVRTPDGSIIMPLANGDLHQLIPVSLRQAAEIVFTIGQQLLCLHSHGIRYFDVKAVNCLYYCRSNGRIDISLADIGSIIPIRDVTVHEAGHVAEDYHIATTTPPGYEKIPVPSNLPHVESYYTYLLLDLLRHLVTKRMFTSLSDGKMEASFKANFGYDVSVNRNMPSYSTMPEFIRSLRADVINFYEMMLVHPDTEVAHVLADVMKSMGRQLDLLLVTGAERNKMLELDIIPIDHFLSKLGRALN